MIDESSVRKFINEKPYGCLFIKNINTDTGETKTYVNPTSNNIKRGYSRKSCRHVFLQQAMKSSAFVISFQKTAAFKNKSYSHKFFRSAKKAWRLITNNTMKIGKF